jgi:hypothetical protein
MYYGGIHGFEGLTQRDLDSIRQIIELDASIPLLDEDFFVEL